MARKRVSLGGKKFFSLVVLSSMALGLLFTANFAVQQKTNTQSDAACGAAPSITLKGASDGANSITYHLSLTNNCPSESWNRFKLSVSNIPTTPVKYSDWKWRFSTPQKNGSWNTTFERDYLGGGKSASIDVTISRENINNIKSGTYSPFTVKAWRFNDSSKQDTLNLKYIVTSGTKTVSNDSGSSGSSTNSGSDTKSNTQKNCTTPPTIYDVRPSSGTTLNDGRKTYRATIQIKNNCKEAEKYKTYITGDLLQGGHWYLNFYGKTSNTYNTPLILLVTDNQNLSLTLTLRKNFKDYGTRFNVISELSSNSSIKSVKSVHLN